MTVREFPVAIWTNVRREWFGDAYYDAFLDAGERYDDVVLVPDNPMPDREGGFGIDPDDDTKRFEWDTDLSVGEAALFDEIVKAHGGDTDGVPGSSGAAAAIDTMKAFRTRGGTPTDAQRDAAIDAVIDYVRFISRDG